MFRIITFLVNWVWGKIDEVWKNIHDIWASFGHRGRLSTANKQRKTNPNKHFFLQLIKFAFNHPFRQNIITFSNCLLSFETFEKNSSNWRVFFKKLLHFKLLLSKSLWISETWIWWIISDLRAISIQENAAKLSRFGILTNNIPWQIFQPTYSQRSDTVIPRF